MIDTSNYYNINNLKEKEKVLEFVKIYNLADPFRKKLSTNELIYSETKKSIEESMIHNNLPLFSRIFN